MSLEFFPNIINKNLKGRCMIKKIFIPLVVSMSISACGGGSGGGKEPVAVSPSVGVFKDSIVGGVYYETPTRSGFTNAKGEFDYLPGETVTFKIGDIVLGSSTCGDVLTPLSLVPGAVDANNPVVTNIVRLLLTLDADGDPSNGITVTPAASNAAVGKTVDFTVVDFDSDLDVLDLLNDLPGNPTLVDATTAQTHFAATLAAESNWGALSWGTGTWKAK